MDLSSALAQLEFFSTPAHLTRRISELETALVRVRGGSTRDLLTSEGIDNSILEAAVAIKQAAGQVNVSIHALGIALALPHLMEKDEEIISVSLGAGNTGRRFDLETDRRVAEFKFIAWRGGAESIRQNGIFVDLLHLLQDSTSRKRFMYVVNKEVPERFLHGNRAIASVLSKNSSAATTFQDLYGTRYTRVRDWYAREARGNVEIVDLRDVLPAFASNAIQQATTVPPIAGAG